MSLLVSVIVPVYKVEKYLEQCVHSIAGQTYRNIEIILVDDGSPDKSGELCDKLVQKDSRIKVVHKSNGGLSDARNVGMANATGKYIMFVDSDDFWSSDECLEKLVNYIELYKSPDFIGFNISYYYPSENRYNPWGEYNSSITDEADRDELICKLVGTGTFPMSAGAKIINREFYERNNISFIKGVYSEDIPWFVELLDKSKTVRFVNEYIYCYRQEVTTSITKTFTLKKYTDLLDHIDRILSMLQGSSFSEEAKKALLSFCAYEFCIALGYCRLVGAKKDNRLKNYTWLLSYQTNLKVKKVALLYRLAGFDVTSRICAQFIKSKK